MIPAGLAPLPHGQRPTRATYGVLVRRRGTTAPVLALAGPASRSDRLPWCPPTIHPLAFLLALMQGAGQDMATRLRAAVAALPYCHARMTATTKPNGIQPAAQAYPKH